MQVRNQKLNNSFKFCGGNLGSRLTPEYFTIPIISGYQIYSRFSKAEKAEKKNVLIRDFIVLASTCLGAWGGVKVAQKIFRSNKEVAKQVLGLPIGGILAGMVAGEVTEKIFPAKYPQLEEALKNNYEALKKAENKHERRKRVLKTAVKNIAMLGMTSVGVVAGYTLSGKIISSNRFKLKALSEVQQKTIQIASILASGLATSLASRAVLNKIFPQGKEIQVDCLSNFSNSYTLFETVSNSAFSSTFSNTFNTLNGFNVGRSVGVENRLKKGFYEIITGVILPAAIIFPIAGTVSKKLEKAEVFEKIWKNFEKVVPNMILKKIPEKASRIKFVERTVLLPITAIGIFFGNKIGSWFNEKVTEKILKRVIWIQSKEVQQELVKENLKAIGLQDEQAKKEAILKLAKTRELAQEIEQDKDIQEELLHNDLT